VNKRTIIIIVSFVVIAAVVGLLLHNRATLAKGSAGVVLSAYPVTVTTVQKETLEEVLTFTGTIAANNDVAIVAETSGRVKAIRARVGDLKQAGSVLIEVDDELAAANCAAAEVAYEKAKRDLERYENLFKKNSISESQCEGVRLNCKAAEAQYITARRILRNTKITTPITGTVTSCTPDVGAMVQDNATVANVVDIATLKVKLGVPEEDVFKLTVDEPTEVTTEVYPGVIFTGTIHTIGSKADEAHTYPVEVILTNREDTPLKANMFGKVTIRPHYRKEALLLPRAALVGSVEIPQVFVVSQSVAKLRNIAIGGVRGLDVEVLSGLTPQDTVVLNGQYNLRDNATVAVVGKGGGQ
jgi:RND family efflux transporter MFP subunit